MFRIIPHPPNFTPVIAFAILGPLLMRDKMLGVLLPILSMFISDFIIGFHPYQLVIYLTLISISIFSKAQNTNSKILLICIFSSIWFFLTTNFAVWLIWDYYPKSIKGLIYCYTMGIPFLQNTLLGTLFFTFLIKFLSKYFDKINLIIFNYIRKAT